MSKARRVSPTRGTGASTAAGKSPLVDLLQTAADIVAALPDAVVVTGTDRRVLATNQAGADMLGWQVGDIVGQAIADNVSPGERSHVASREDRVLEGETQRYETRIVNHRTGEERDVAVSSGPFRMQGEIIGTVATLRDITEPKRAQETLARSEARYRHLVESASDAIVTLDANGRFTTVNHAAENISGYKREELVGQWFAPMLPDDDLPRFHHSCARVPDWEDFRRRVDEQPYPVVIEGASGGDLKFLFLDTRDLLGHFLEYTWMTDASWERLGGR